MLLNCTSVDWCGKGTFLDRKASKCFPCPQGYYNMHERQRMSACEPCEINRCLPFVCTLTDAPQSHVYHELRIALPKKIAMLLWFFLNACGLRVCQVCDARRQRFMCVLFRTFWDSHRRQLRAPSSVFPVDSGSPFRHLYCFFFQSKKLAKIKGMISPFHKHGIFMTYQPYTDPALKRCLDIPCMFSDIF